MRKLCGFCEKESIVRHWVKFQYVNGKRVDVKLLVCPDCIQNMEIENVHPMLAAAKWVAGEVTDVN